MSKQRVPNCQMTLVIFLLTNPSKIIEFAPYWIPVFLILLLILSYICVIKKVKIQVVKQKLINVAVIIIFYIRGLLTKETVWFSPLTMTILFVIAYNMIIYFTNIQTLAFIQMVTGIYLLGIDDLGSRLSEIISKGGLSEVRSFLESKQNNSLIEHIRTQSFTALIIGKTAMTPAGRAAIICGFLTIGGMWANTMIYNYQIEQREAAVQTREHAFQHNENELNRQFQARQFRKEKEWEAYKSSWNPWKKPPQD